LTTNDQPADWEALLESIDGDRDFASELVLLFAANSEQGLAAIDVALGNGDYAAAAESAHALKGASANMYAVATSSAAAQLEAAAIAGEHAAVPLLADRLRTELAKTVAYLRSKIG